MDESIAVYLLGFLPRCPARGSFFFGALLFACVSGRARRANMCDCLRAWRLHVGLGVLAARHSPGLSWLVNGGGAVLGIARPPPAL